MRVLLNEKMEPPLIDCRQSAGGLRHSVSSTRNAIHQRHLADQRASDGYADCSSKLLVSFVCFVVNSPAFMSDERKTLEQRATMTDLERLRHSASHVLATAILKIWPEAQFAAGPPVENGFYYDVDLSHRISPDDFAKIETEMKKEIKANHPFERIEVSRG